MRGISALPEIDGALCVHALAPRAGCSACVDVCPREALLLDDDGLKLDTDACDGCGQCLPACPRAAIGLAPPPVSHCDVRVDATALAECREVAAGRRGAPGALPCQHALGTRDLDALAQDGVRQLIITTAECTRCASAPKGPGLAGALALHRAVRASRGLPVLQVEGRIVSPGTPPPSYPASALASVDRSRRRLFATLLAPRTTPEPARDTPPRAYCAPIIDGTRCTGCDACARICPDNALIRQGLPEQGYRLVPDHCSGCGLCVDICESGAVTLQALASAHESLLRLETRRCDACGVPFSTPEAGASGGGASTQTTPARCPICRSHPHLRQLFQVITSE